MGRIRGSLPIEGFANLLVGTYPGKTLAVGEGYYIRATGTNIYRATAAVTLPPFSCYMPSDEKRTYFKLEEATGITEIENEELKMNNGESGAAIYDLSGRRVSKPQKGVYIKKGKKFMVK